MEPEAHSGRHPRKKGQHGALEGERAADIG